MYTASPVLAMQPSLCSVLKPGAGDHCPEAKLYFSLVMSALAPLYVEKPAATTMSVTLPEVASVNAPAPKRYLSVDMSFLATYVCRTES